MVKRRTNAGLSATNHGKLQARREQRGFVVIALAVIGLLGAAAVAVPVINRATTGLRAHSASDLGEMNGARAAAEHGIWRIRTDGPFVDSFTGSPAGASYELNWGGTPANIDAHALSTGAPNNGMHVYLVATPEIVRPNQPTVVTMTLTVTNFDTEPHQISRITADPLLWNPPYVAGSTSGITNSNPTSCTSLFGCRWDIFPHYTLSPHGGSASLTFSFLVTKGAGMYWTDGSARVEGVGTVVAPLTTRTNVTNFGDPNVTASVIALDPINGTTNEVIAGVPSEFEYTITVYALGGGDNNGNGNDDDWNLDGVLDCQDDDDGQDDDGNGSDIDNDCAGQGNYSDEITLSWLIWQIPVTFDLLPGTVTLNEEPIADPTLSFDWVANRELSLWSFLPEGVGLSPGNPLVFKFRAIATLNPGIYKAISAVKMQEDTDFGPISSKSTGETAPVIARREYRIEATHLGHTVDVTLAPGPAGTNITSWTEQ